MKEEIYFPLALVNNNNNKLRKWSTAINNKKKHR